MKEKWAKKKKKEKYEQLQENAGQR